ncbi:Myosin regulatory light polypeptide 9 [Lemmus lemmus]
MLSKRANTKTTKKHPECATSNIFAMFDQFQFQEFKESFNMIDQKWDGFTNKEDLYDMLPSIDEEVDELSNEAPLRKRGISTTLSSQVSSSMEQKTKMTEELQIPTRCSLLTLGGISEIFLLEPCACPTFLLFAFLVLYLYNLRFFGPHVFL